MSNPGDDRTLDTDEVWYVGKSGERPCLTCGKPHVYRSHERYAGTWADPLDGHIYRPESWRSIARRLMTEHVAKGR